jgi:hypothetical protein
MGKAFALTDTPEFHKLMDTLKTIVDNDDDDLVSTVIYCAAIFYDARVFRHGFPGLYDLAEPLSQVIDILKNDELREGVLMLLGAHPIRVVVQAHPEDTEDIGPIVARHKRLISDLERMKTTLAKMPRPPKLNPGNPREARDLFDVLSALAVGWTEITGTPFKVHWQGYEPLTPAMRFVYEIVKFIAPTRVNELPTVTKKVRRRITVNKKFAS